MTAPIITSYWVGKTQLQLATLLCSVPENGLQWHILIFEGGALHPSDVDWAGLEVTTSESPYGVTMTWDELLVLAELVEAFFDMYDCLILAVEDPTKVNFAEIRRTVYYSSLHKLNVEVLIDLSDSSAWTLWARDRSIMEKWARLPQE